MRNSGKDSCKGDSGGSLACDRKLVGLVSFGRKCADPQYPGIYANVTAVLPWITAAIKANA